MGDIIDINLRRETGIREAKERAIAEAAQALITRFIEEAVSIGGLEFAGLLHQGHATWRIALIVAPENQGPPPPA